MTTAIPSRASAAAPCRRVRRLGISLAVVLATLALAWQLAAHRLQQEMVAALGPRSEVGSIGLAWGGVEIRGLRIAAAPGSGWPVADELRAPRVVVTPDLWSALRGRIGVHSVRIEDGYISLLRGRDGQMQVLPALLGRRERAGAERRGGSLPAVRIGDVQLRGTEIAFYDASVSRPPLALRLVDMQASIGPLALPSLDVATQIDLTAGVRGARAGPEGRLELRGSATGATRDAALKLSLRRVDLLALQPYVNRVAQGGVRRGTLDLDLAPTVKNQQLHAPGHMTLSQLELGDGNFAGLPRKAMLAFMNRHERIELDFTLEGRLDDPAFSLNENFATRVASALGNVVGLSVEGVVEGVGSVVKGLFGR
ncbi:hypothetical protein C1M51_03040 [Methylibium sp. Pch-M]|uniref:DUF748 domain-containing protein n=1 Tax=Methylibium sp. Pch-M TaxID=2082386 RepID=UPI001012BC80|nr:DUF748 domain-containing protein [Methylibium sp. Pch-M]QAZ38479.1 hypothetical protein C1M51_03040 [Methylibium sp. Pch-M]